jgi:hypothetical protein
MTDDSTCMQHVHVVNRNHSKEEEVEEESLSSGTPKTPKRHSRALQLLSQLLARYSKSRLIASS